MGFVIHLHLLEFSWCKTEPGTQAFGDYNSQCFLPSGNRSTFLEWTGNTFLTGDSRHLVEGYFHWMWQDIFWVLLNRESKLKKKLVSSKFIKYLAQSLPASRSSTLGVHGTYQNEGLHLLKGYRLRVLLLKNRIKLFQLKVIKYLVARHCCVSSFFSFCTPQTW